MTRGQDSLLGEGGDDLDEQISVHSADMFRSQLRVLTANAQELALHTQQLADIAKASKGACLWLQLS